MLIVLGGLAALPTEPYRAARIDGASRWQVIRYVTIPLVWPYIMVAIILRAIDALKTFDIIYVMKGPGTATETLNIFLYPPTGVRVLLHSVSPSAVAVVYFLILMFMSVGLMITRKKMSWQATARRLGSRLAFAGFLFLLMVSDAVLLLLDDLAVAQDGLLH